MRMLSDEEWSGKTNTVCLIEWAEQYLAFVRGRFGAKTYDEKKSVFRRFFREINPELAVEELTPAMVLDYIQNQKKARSGYGANKDRKNLVAGWNWGRTYLKPVVLPSLNPCRVVKMDEDRTPRYIPPENDFWKVFEVTEGQDRVMLLAFLYLAGRRGEIFRLTISDLDFETNRIRLWTRKRKGGNLEPDWLPMTKELKKALTWWIETRPIQESEYVFLCLDENQLLGEYYGKPFRFRVKMMRRLCEKAGVKRFGFHAIRHLTATQLYQQGYSVAIVQAILRHKSPSTTERYLKTLGLEDVREALDGMYQKKGKILEFDRQRPGGKIAVLNEKAVCGAVK